MIETKNEMTDYNLKNKHNEIIKYFSPVFLFELNY